MAAKYSGLRYAPPVATGGPPRFCYPRRIAPPDHLAMSLASTHPRSRLGNRPIVGRPAGRLKDCLCGQGRHPAAVGTDGHGQFRRPAKFPVPRARLVLRGVGLGGPCANRADPPGPGHPAGLPIGPSGWAVGALAAEADDRSPDRGGLGLGLVLGTGWVVKSQFVNIADKLPAYRDRIHTKWKACGVPVGTFQQAASKIKAIVEEATKPASQPGEASPEPAPCWMVHPATPAAPTPDIAEESAAGQQRAGR